ncbi:hypothetical protein H6P81_013162 [Aristolochia fimbriata]|uniref:Uncharacterized protein n=1 Tax=Aristolochia fimbriata TaxID=158543 RepID=A0AAV7EEA0_ARIFI|nr:hypothetical protein H6P81_013162 [Aristolochia fimbriata]
MAGLGGIRRRPAPPPSRTYVFLKLQNGADEKGESTSAWRRLCFSPFGDAGIYGGRREKADKEEEPCMATRCERGGGYKRQGKGRQGSFELQWCAPRQAENHVKAATPPPARRPPADLSCRNKSLRFKARSSLRKGQQPADRFSSLPS